jgi:hypothetical protein
VVPGGLTLDPSEYDEGTAEFEAGTLIARQMLDQRFRHDDAFLSRGAREHGKEWFSAAALMSARATLTAEELAAANEEIAGVIESVLERYRGRDAVEGARLVVLHYQAFPVMGAPVPEDRS